MLKPRREVISLLPKNAVGAEIGVWKGDFSAAILAGASPKKLYLIDPWIIQNDPQHEKSWYGDPSRVDINQIHDQVCARFSKEIALGTVTIMRSFSEKALAEFPDNSFDFIYIDGDHEYSGVRKDCFIAFDKVRPGGLICGDDYSLGGWWRDGVVRAFHDLLSERNVVLKLMIKNQIVVQKRIR